MASGWFLAQGVAGTIERCARSAPDVDLRFAVFFKQVGYLALAAVVFAVLVPGVGALVRAGALPLLPCVISINVCALFMAGRIALLSMRFVQSVGKRLGDIPAQLPDRYLGIEMSLARIWNLSAAIACLVFALAANDAWSASTQSSRVSPSVALSLMPLLYFGSGYFFYMAYLIGTTKRFASGSATND
jgi:hypothetical protein